MALQLVKVRVPDVATTECDLCTPWKVGNASWAFMLVKKNIEMISKFRQMYEIAGVSMKYCEFFLDNHGIIEDYWKDVVDEKSRLLYQLRGLEIIDTRTNWIHFNTDDDNKKTKEIFAKHKVLVKWGTIPHDNRKHWCRMTIQPGLGNEPFIQELIDAY